MIRQSFAISVIALSVFALTQTAFAQTNPKPTARKPPAAKPSKPQRIIYKPDGLPKPFATDSVRNPPRVVAQPSGAKLELPAGFNVEVFAEYRNDAFVALHGSWNRKNRTGYKVISIPFKNGKPEGGYENFLTGWVPDEAGPEVWVRPVGVTMIKDGSLLVVDDGGKKIWRVTYGKK
ncbi:MAG: hypothetical protein SF097_16255 [Acidobacteriota bacterium]|nr:hypothetical protein [Acidobacteriota bacterium]